MLASGHYANVVRVDEPTGIAITTDGVGTKLVVAEQLGRWDTVGIDCVAMNVNDVVCVGADRWRWSTTWRSTGPTRDRRGDRRRAWPRGAELAGIEIVGGELAQLGEIINGLDLAGACFGRSRWTRSSPVPRSSRATPSSACPPPASTPTATRSPVRRSRGSRSTTSASGDRSARSCSSRPRSTSGRSWSCSLRAGGPGARPHHLAAASATCCGSRRRSATRSTIRCRCRRSSR